MKINKTSPIISVIIVSYNFEDFLEECIESVLAQTLRPSEIIICDDCSQDRSPLIIKKYEKIYPNLIKAFFQTKNIGPAKNGEFAFKAATGELVSWMDGDDRWLPQKLEYEWAALCNNTEAKIAYSNVYQIDGEGKQVLKWCHDNDRALPEGDVFIKTYSKDFFPNRRGLFRNFLFYRSCYKKIGFVDMNLNSFWDWDEKIRLTSNYLVAYSGKALVEYRINPEGLSKSNSTIRLQAFKDVYEKHLHLLGSRNIEEKAQVQVRLESIAAIRQYKILGSKFDNKYSIENVFKRNLQLLKKLPKNARTALIQNNRKTLDKLLKFVIRDKISNGQILSGFWYQFMFFNCEFGMLKSIATAFFKILQYLTRWMRK